MARMMEDLTIRGEMAAGDDGKIRVESAGGALNGLRRWSEGTFVRKESKCIRYNSQTYLHSQLE
jgi:hypothetical protein